MAIEFAKKQSDRLDWSSWLKKRFLRLYPTY
jgi:hypothetical protein